MRDTMRDKLNTEITRKQFLQYMAAALLAVFGLNNLLSLLSGRHDVHHIVTMTDAAGGSHGFGSSRFGV